MTDKKRSPLQLSGIGREVRLEAYKWKVTPDLGGNCSYEKIADFLCFTYLLIPEQQLKTITKHFTFLEL